MKKIICTLTIFTSLFAYASGSDGLDYTLVQENHTSKRLPVLNELVGFSPDLSGDQWETYKYTLNHLGNLDESLLFIERARPNAVNRLIAKAQTSTDQLVDVEVSNRLYSVVQETHMNSAPGKPPLMCVTTLDFGEVILSRWDWQPQDPSACR